MGFITWVKETFSRLIAKFNAFIKEAFTNEMKMLIAEFKDFAIVVVGELATADLSSDAKRAEAFKKIKDEAIKRSKALPDSIINILIELAVSRLKAQVTQ